MKSSMWLNSSRSSRGLFIVLLTGMAAFIYFTAGSKLLAVLGDSGSSPVWSMAVRLVLALIVATVMLVIERRRATPSVNAALADGIQVAAVVIVANNLTGATDTGARLAVRSAIVLIGLPLLAVLTHLLSRRIGAGGRAQRA